MSIKGYFFTAALASAAGAWGGNSFGEVSTQQEMTQQIETALGTLVGVKLTQEQLIAYRKGDLCAEAIIRGFGERLESINTDPSVKPPYIAYLVDQPAYGYCERLKTEVAKKPTPPGRR